MLISAVSGSGEYANSSNIVKKIDGRFVRVTLVGATLIVAEEFPWQRRWRLDRTRPASESDHS